MTQRISLEDCNIEYLLCDYGNDMAIEWEWFMTKCPETRSFLLR